MKLIMENWKRFLKETEADEMTTMIIDLQKQGYSPEELELQLFDSFPDASEEEITQAIEGAIARVTGAEVEIGSDEAPAPELPFFNQLVENKLEEKSKKLNLLNEADLELELPSGGALSIHTEFQKWLTISGVSAGAFATALQIAALYAPWQSVLVVLAPALLTLALNPVVMAAGTAVALRFKPTRKIIVWILKKFGGKTITMISDSIAQVIDKMVESSNAQLSKDNAIQLFGMIAQYIVNNGDFRGKLKALFLALKDKNEAQTALISAELQDLLKTLIRRDILGLSETELQQLPAPDEPEAPAREPEGDIDFDQVDQDVLGRPAALPAQAAE
jgi:hypothetical protein